MAIACGLQVGTGVAGRGDLHSPESKREVEGGTPRDS